MKLGACFFLKPSKAVYTNGRTLFVQGGDLTVALLLPASVVGLGQVNQYPDTGGLQTTT